MGLFEDEAKKMEDEKRAKEARYNDPEQMAEFSEIAKQVGLDLASYVNAHPAPDGNVEIVVSNNRITARKSNSSHKLEIICVGKDEFACISGDLEWPMYKKDRMAQFVLDWLNG